MRSWKENQLSYLFPFMRKEYVNKDDNLVIKSVECECDDGWFNLIFELCRDISLIFSECHIEPFIRILQIKEKYGMLRVYWGLDYPDGLSPDDRVSLNDRISGVVNEYEDKSLSVCECCGKPGALSAINHWVVTRCKDCRSSDIIYYTTDPSKSEAGWVLRMVNLLKSTVGYNHVWEIIRDIVFCLHDTPGVVDYDDGKAVATILTHIKYLQGIRRESR